MDIIPQLFPTDDILDFLVRPAAIASDAVVVDEGLEECRFGKQIMTFGLKERTTKIDSDACLEDYICERVSNNINKRLMTMFDDDLPDIFSRITHNLRAASASAHPDNVSVTVNVEGGNHRRSVMASGSTSMASAAASE